MVKKVLNDFLHGAGADATGANIAALDLAVLLKTDFLQVGQPPVTGQVMCMADPVPVLGALIANRAFPAHGALLLKDFPKVEFQDAAI